MGRRGLAGGECVRTARRGRAYPFRGKMAGVDALGEEGIASCLIAK